MELAVAVVAVVAVLAVVVVVVGRGTSAGLTLPAAVADTAVQKEREGGHNP